MIVLRLESRVLFIYTYSEYRDESSVQRIRAAVVGLTPFFRQIGNPTAEVMRRCSNVKTRTSQSAFRAFNDDQIC